MFDSKGRIKMTCETKGSPDTMGTIFDQLFGEQPTVSDRTVQALQTAETDSKFLDAMRNFAKEPKFAAQAQIAAQAVFDAMMNGNLSALSIIHCQHMLNLLLARCEQELNTPVVRYDRTSG
jgi:hypothetical protein